MLSASMMFEWLADRYNGIFIDPVKLTNGTLKKEDIMQAINKTGNATLIYSS